MGIKFLHNRYPNWVEVKGRGQVGSQVINNSNKCDNIKHRNMQIDTLA